MARTTGTGMRLRARIVRPLRYEDDHDVHMRRRSFGRRNGSQPAFPELLAQQVILFDPNHPPAEFPSLPLTQQPTQNEGLVQQTESEVPREETATSLPQASTSLDVSQLVDETGQDNVVDFSLSNNIAAGDTPGVDPLNTDYESLPEESVQWESLELAYQHRIFSALCKTGDQQQAVQWLGLSEADTITIKKAVAWRKKHPLTLTQQHGGQVNWLEPRLLSKYSGYLNQISVYELGSSMQLLRAGMFLQQVKLPLELLGIWILDPFGTGDLIDSTPLVQLFPVGMLTPRQLQHVFMHGAPELRPPVIQPEPSQVTAAAEGESGTVDAAEGNHPRPVPRKIVKLKYGKKQSTGRPVGRPRKHRPASTTQLNKNETMPAVGTHEEGSLASTAAGTSTNVVGGDATDPSAEDAATVLSHWTQPAPGGSKRSQPPLPGSDQRAMVGRDGEVTGAASVQNSTDTTNVPDTWIDPAHLLPGNTNDNKRPSSEASVSTAVAKPLRLKLKISTTGVASVTSATPVPSSTATTGKSLDNFATTPSLRDNTPDSRTTLVNPSLPPWSTPNPVRIKFEQPARAEDDFKTSTREVPSLSTSSPAQFGEANNFGTKLILHRRPVTPDTEGLGIFASAEDHADHQLSPGDLAAALTPHRLRQAREWAREEGSPTPMQRRVFAGVGTPKADEVVRSIEEDADMSDAPALEQDRSRIASLQRSPLADRGLIARDFSDAVRRSPSPPRSTSPISVNEDFEEYQSWLRGETGHGPMPQSSVVAGQTPAVPGSPTQAPGVQTPPIQTRASQTPAAGRELGDPGSKIVKLRVAVTNEELMEASRMNAPGTDFIDPGEEGDGEWEEPAPKRKKTSAKKATPRKVSPKTASSKQASPKTTAPDQETPKQPKPRNTPKSSSATKKVAPKKKPAANQELLKRATRAQSLAVSEASDAPRTRSRSSTPVPTSEEGLSSTAKRKRTQSVEPRRSFLLSSADITDDTETARPIARQKKDAPLRAKLTPVSRLRSSMTPSRSTDEVDLKNEAGVSDVDSDATVMSTSTGKPRKKWTHKHYEKTRESSRLADMDVPNMKV